MRNRKPSLLLYLVIVIILLIILISLISFFYKSFFPAEQQETSAQQFEVGKECQIYDYKNEPIKDGTLNEQGVCIEKQ